MRAVFLTTNDGHDLPIFCEIGDNRPLSKAFRLPIFREMGDNWPRSKAFRRRGGVRLFPRRLQARAT